MITKSQLQAAIDVCPTEEEAALVAAAPALLEALQLLVSLDDSLHIGVAHGCTIAFADAQAAIAAATKGA